MGCEISKRLYGWKCFINSEDTYWYQIDKNIISIDLHLGDKCEDFTYKA